MVKNWLILTILFIPLIFSFGCGAGDDDLYIRGTITGEVVAIPNSMKDIAVNIYKLEGIGDTTGSDHLEDDYRAFGL